MKNILSKVFTVLLAVTLLLGGVTMPVAHASESATTPTETSGARYDNIVLAAEALDGYTILPGGTFSFNHVIGDRTEERGYAEAENGRGVTVVGGGTAQLATTLYLAVKDMSGVKFTELAFYGDDFAGSYVSDGSDAIVVDWRGQDFAFKNKTGNTMSIKTKVEDGEVYVKVSSSKYTYGYGTTYLYGNKTRRTNVKLAYKAINGFTMSNGDTFSFNTLVGPRTESAGFGSAANGRGVKTIGGGVAQVASTVYLAVKDNPDFEITEKHTYGSKYSEYYVDSADDAIVTDDDAGTDFTFTYKGSGTVEFKMFVQAETLICEIVGTDKPSHTVAPVEDPTPKPTPKPTPIPTDDPVTRYIGNCNDWVTMRKSADSNSEKVISLPLGTEVETYATVGKYVYCSFGDSFGFVSKTYITKDELDPIGTDTIANCESYVYMRSRNASEGAEKIRKVPLDAKIDVYGEHEGEYTLIGYKGDIGYVASKYLGSYTVKPTYDFGVWYPWANDLYDALSEKMLACAELDGFDTSFLKQDLDAFTLIDLNGDGVPEVSDAVANVIYQLVDGKLEPIAEGSIYNAYTFGMLPAFATWSASDDGSVTVNTYEYQRNGALYQMCGVTRSVAYEGYQLKSKYFAAEAEIPEGLAYSYLKEKDSAYRPADVKFATTDNFVMDEEKAEMACYQTAANLIFAFKAAQPAPFVPKYEIVPGTTSLMGILDIPAPNHGMPGYNFGEENAWATDVCTAVTEYLLNTADSLRYGLSLFNEEEVTDEQIRQEIVAEADMIGLTDLTGDGIPEVWVSNSDGGAIYEVKNGELCFVYYGTPNYTALKTEPDGSVTNYVVSSAEWGGGIGLTCQWTNDENGDLLMVHEYASEMGMNEQPDLYMDGKPANVAAYSAALANIQTAAVPDSRKGSAVNLYELTGENVDEALAAAACQLVAEYVNK